MRYYGNELVYHEQYSKVKVHISENLYIFFQWMDLLYLQSIYLFYAFSPLDLVKTVIRAKVESKFKYKRLVCRRYTASED